MSLTVFQTRLYTSHNSNCLFNTITFNYKHLKMDTSEIKFLFYSFSTFFILLKSLILPPKPGCLILFSVLASSIPSSLHLSNNRESTICGDFLDLFFSVYPKCYCVKISPSTSFTWKAAIITKCSGYYSIFQMKKFFIWKSQIFLPYHKLITLWSIFTAYSFSFWISSHLSYWQMKSSQIWCSTEIYPW